MPIPDLFSSRALALGLGLLISSCALGACAGSSKAGGGSALPRTAADYAPLKVGAWWNYDMSYPGQSGEMTVRVTGEKEGYFVDDKNGALRLTQDGLRDRDRYLLRHPLAVGTKWSAVVGPSAVEKSEILSVGEPCEVAAGRYGDCVVVASTLRRDPSVALTIRWTWAKGVGLVRVETEADIRGRGIVPQTKQVLRRFSLDASVPPPPDVAPPVPAAPPPPAAAPKKPNPKSGGAEGPGKWEDG